MKILATQLFKTLSVFPSKFVFQNVNRFEDVSDQSLVESEKVRYNYTNKAFGRGEYFAIHKKAQLKADPDTRKGVIELQEALDDYGLYDDAIAALKDKESEFYKYIKSARYNKSGAATKAYRFASSLKKLDGGGEFPKAVPGEFDHKDRMGVAYLQFISGITVDGAYGQQTHKSMLNYGVTIRERLDKVAESKRELTEFSAMFDIDNMEGMRKGPGRMIRMLSVAQEARFKIGHPNYVEKPAEVKKATADFQRAAMNSGLYDLTISLLKDKNSDLYKTIATDSSSSDISTFLSEYEAGTFKFNRAINGYFGKDDALVACCVQHLAGKGVDGILGGDFYEAMDEAQDVIGAHKSFQNEFEDLARDMAEQNDTYPDMQNVDAFFIRNPGKVFEYDSRKELAADAPNKEAVKSMQRVLSELNAYDLAEKELSQRNSSFVTDLKNHPLPHLRKLANYTSLDDTADGYIGRGTQIAMLFVQWKLGVRGPALDGEIGQGTWGKIEARRDAINAPHAATTNPTGIDWSKQYSESTDKWRPSIDIMDNLSSIIGVNKGDMITRIGRSTVDKLINHVASVLGVPSFKADIATGGTNVGDQDGALFDYFGRIDDEIVKIWIKNALDAYPSTPNRPLSGVDLNSADEVTFKYKGSDYRHNNSGSNDGLFIKVGGVEKQFQMRYGNENQALSYYVPTTGISGALYFVKDDNAGTITRLAKANVPKHILNNTHPTR